MGKESTENFREDKLIRKECPPMAYTELSAISKRTIFCTFVHQGDKKLHHLTGEDRKLPDECRRKQIVKVVTR